MNLKEQIAEQKSIIQAAIKEIQLLTIPQNIVIRNANSRINILKQSAVPKNHNIGDWDCDESPLGLCVYSDKDIAQDSCIYCGQPDERK